MDQRLAMIETPGYHPRCDKYNSAVII